ncbi:unnamed protein product, partial [Urochloa humidicola]
SAKPANPFHSFVGDGGPLLLRRLHDDPRRRKPALAHCFAGSPRAPMPLPSGRNSFLPRPEFFFLERRAGRAERSTVRRRSSTGATQQRLPIQGGTLSFPSPRGPSLGSLAMSGGLLPHRGGGPRRGRRDDDDGSAKSGDGGADSFPQWG